MDRDYDVLLHNTGGVLPSHALALAHPNGNAPQMPIVHDARAVAQMAAEMQHMRQQLSTLQQQQRNVLAYLTAACAAALRGEAAPSLLPESDQKSQAAA